MLDAFLESLRDGGGIMYVLTFICLVTWYCVGLRASRLSKANLNNDLHESMVVFEKLSVRNDKQRRAAMNAIMAEARIRLNLGETLLQSCVLVAPLLGLLGTIVGMIETFEAMASSSSLNPADSMSDGISKAMFTTQVGLLVSLPGLLFSVALKSKKKRYLAALASSFCRHREPRIAASVAAHGGDQ